MGAPAGHPFFGNQYSSGDYVIGSFDLIVDRLYFNSLHRPGYLQHVYDLKGKDARFNEPVYEHAGDEETNHPNRLERVGIDLPAHAFVNGSLE